MTTIATTLKIFVGSNALLAIVALSGPANGQSQKFAEEAVCTLEGFTNNRFGKDVIVRSAPSETAPVVGHLPLTSGDLLTTAGDDLYSMRFGIVESRNGWLRLTNISDSYNDGETDRAAIIAGKSGWVSSNAVRFQIQSARGFDAPRATANKIIDLEDNWATDAGVIENVIACNGQWALIDLRLKYNRLDDHHLIKPDSNDKSIKRAWFQGICGSEETTCDMASVDTDQ